MQNFTFEQYQKESFTNIQPHADKKDELLNWSVGLAEEVGETLNYIKHNCWGDEKIDKAGIAKEMGDVLWYLSAMCTNLDINLSTVAELNLKKLQHRFGDEYNVEKSQNRHEAEAKFSETETYKKLINELDRG